MHALPGPLKKSEFGGRLFFVLPCELFSQTPDRLAFLPPTAFARLFPGHVLLDITQYSSSFILAAKLAQSLLQVVFDLYFYVFWHFLSRALSACGRRAEEPSPPYLQNSETVPPCWPEIKEMELPDRAERILSLPL